MRVHLPCLWAGLAATLAVLGASCVPPVTSTPDAGGDIRPDAGDPAPDRGVATTPTRVDDVVADALGVRQTPALAAAVVDVDGVVSWGASGARVAGQADQVTVDDPWHLGSNTKAMTAVLAGRLVDQGVVDWDLAVLDVWPQADAGWQNVTLEKLLHHRGGASSNLIAQHPSLWSALWQEPDPSAARHALLEALLALPPDETVDDFAYSNAGYMMAGAMLELRADATWRALMQRDLFDPLQMTGCGFGPPTGDVPHGHRISNNALTSVSPGLEADNPAGLGPAGTVHCPLDDWAKFIAVHLPGHALPDGTPYLMSTTLERLHTPTGDYAGGWLVAERPWAAPEGNGVVLTHSGSNTMWLSVAWVAPELGLAFLATTNSATADASVATDTVIGALIESTSSQ